MSMIRGACPSIDKPMETGDGLLTRLTPLVGHFTPAELTRVAMAADECGNGVMEVSTRGNLQVRGLTVNTLPTFMTKLDEAELELNRNVPVVVNPLGGFDRHELKDPRDMQARLRAAIGVRDLFQKLSPKTSVIIDGGGQFNLSQLIGDVRLKAVRVEAGVKWQVLTGGIEARSKLLGTMTDDDAAVDAVMALLTRIAARGIAARGRDLDVSDFADINSTNPSAIGGSSPHVKLQMPVGMFRLKSGAYAVGMALPYGTTTTGSILLLARDAETAGASKIEPAQAKTILVFDMDEKFATNFKSSIKDHGFIVEPDDPRLAIVTCAGSPACKSGFIETHALADEIVGEFDADLSGDVCLHISACKKRCAQPGRPAIEILGTDKGAVIISNGVGELHVSREEILPEIGRILKSRI